MQYEFQVRTNCSNGSSDWSVSEIFWTSIGNEQSGGVLPNKFALAQNFPNPFNPNTYIRYAIPEQGYVSIKIYDAIGKEVKTLVQDVHSAGYYVIEWDSKDNSMNKVSSGFYIHELKCNKKVEIKKMLLLK